jgi:hypothetical protein
MSGRKKRATVQSRTRRRSNRGQCAGAGPSAASGGSRSAAPTAALMLDARCRASRTVCWASAGQGRPSGPGIGAQSPSAHPWGWLRLRIVASTEIRPRWSRTTGIALAMALGMMPAVSTMVSASMVSFSSRTRPASIDPMAVEIWISTPRRWDGLTPPVERSWIRRSGRAWRDRVDGGSNGSPTTGPSTRPRPRSLRADH